MSKFKLTPWFPADMKPVHDGRYETQVRDICGTWIPSETPCWLWFEGAWHNDPSTGGTRFLCMEQDRQWRGLAKKPA